MRDAAFRYSSVMTGVTTAPERWQTCTAKATGIIFDNGGILKFLQPSSASPKLRSLLASLNKNKVHKHQ